MIVRAEGKHIAQIAGNLDFVSKIEAEIAGVEDAGAAMLRFLMSGDNPECFSLIDDGELVCSMAIAAHKGRTYTFFLATAGGFEQSLRRIREMRGLMRKLVRERGQIFAVTLSPHPNVARWFALLGARPATLDGRTENVFTWG